MTDRLTKLCGKCFSLLCPGQETGALTWGRECHWCRTPTPSLATLIKVDLARPEIHERAITDEQEKPCPTI